MSSAIPQPPPTFLGNTRSQLKKRTLLFRYLAEINLLLGAWYLHWRVSHSINFNALWLAIPLLLAEIYGYVGGVLFTIGLWRPLERQVRSLDQMIPPLPESDFPTVDVFLTCYNEPIDIIEKTTRAALALDYPLDKLQVYVLDDGNSEAVCTLAHRLALEDQETPQARQRQQQMQDELTDLRHRLDQLETIELDILKLEQLLKAAMSTPAIPLSQSEMTLVQKLFCLLLLSNPQYQDISTALVEEAQKLTVAIRQKEQELARLCRCHYIARPKPSDRPHHAKAGNINYALFSGRTSGQFLVTLDVDHVIKPWFLKRLLPYFYTYNVHVGRYETNRVAFVQTPQDFKDIPEGDPFGHRASLFYGPIQQGKDGLNSAFYTGTNAILRREALVSVGIQQFSKEFAQDANRLEEFNLIGAMATHSITEDMNTAMRLHASGWRSVYHHELMAEGLAPTDLGSTLKQRLRWAQGTIQVLLRDNPLAMPGLTIWQRLQYFQTAYSYFSGFAAVICLSCPIIYFLTGISSVDTNGASFALHFLPGFITNRLTFTVAAWGISSQELWRCEQYAVALFPVFIQAILSVFTKQPLKFQVTPKQRQAGIYLKLVWPQVMVVVLTIIGMLWSLYRFAIGALPDVWVYLVNSAWALYNLLLLLPIIRASVWSPKPKRRRNSLLFLS